jgi:hypothetical protein
MAKLKQEFPKDVPVKIEVTGPGQYELTTMEGLTPLQLKDLEDENAARMFMAHEDDDDNILEAVGLGPWYRKASLLGMAAVTALSTETYIMNEETFVGMCLGGFGMMTYLYARQPFLDMLEAEKRAALKFQNDAEDKHIAACDTFIQSQSGNSSIEMDLDGAFAEKMLLVDLEAKASAIKEKNAVKAEFERKLVSIMNKKADEENQAYKKMIVEAKAYVAAEVKSAKFQKDALAYAITAISAPEKAGSNPTALLFESFLTKK